MTVSDKPKPTYDEIEKQLAAYTAVIKVMYDTLHAPSGGLTKRRTIDVIRAVEDERERLLTMIMESQQ